MAALTDLPNLATVTVPPRTTSTSTTTTTSSTSAANTQPTAIVSLSGLPVIAGAGIPTLAIPYTANAPFMQKSNLPEGTVFIAVGAVLAFLGGCVLLWRGLVAWSINRSVKRSALASVHGSEKNSSGWSSGRGGMYKGLGAGSNLSLDALTSNGKPMRSHLRDDPRRDSTPPPGLFFSPTAKAPGGGNNSSRNSSYLPAGYYAQPAAQTAGGASTTTLGTTIAPYARNSTHHPSPPASPALGPVSRSSPHQRRTVSRDGLTAMANGSVRNSYADVRGSHMSSLHQSHSASDLRAGTPGQDRFGGSRAPSAALDDLYNNHKQGFRERR